MFYICQQFVQANHIGRIIVMSGTIDKWFSMISCGMVFQSIQVLEVVYILKVLSLSTLTQLEVDLLNSTKSNN